MAEKRRSAGRPSRSAKRQRSSTVKAPTPAPAPAPAPAKEATPIVDVVVVVEERESTPLPNKVVESKPLPTLSDPQGLGLPDGEFRSVAESGVLLASLERSRQKWMSGSFLEKYWTKTSGRKDAPPPPPNNPHKSWMKEIGACTIVVEPLVLDATAFYVKEPGLPPPPVAYVPAPVPAPAPAPAPSPQPQQYQYQHHQQQQQQHRPPPPIHSPAPPAPMHANGTGSPYGAPYSTPTSQYHQRSLLPPHTHQPSPDLRPLPPIMPATARAPPPQPPPPAPAPAPTNKQSPDPVIQMLASRASSDPELKALMKIVATGNANQDQLRIFQRHIDELTQMINANKAQPHPTPYAHPTPSRPPPPSTTSPMLQPHHATSSPRPPIYPMPQHSHHNPHPAPPPQPKYHAIPCYPIVLEFQGPNASPDRFRFPENAILEFLSPHSLLASFLIVRKGSDIGTHLDPETEYYEPVTIKMSVIEGRPASKDVLEYIKRSVKPADKVRAWMTETIQKCMRAQRRYLALRLPYKSGIVETEEEPPVVQEVKPKPRPAPKKKKEEKDKDQEREIGKENLQDNASTEKPKEPSEQAAQQVDAVAPPPDVQDGEKQTQPQVEGSVDGPMQDPVEPPNEAPAFEPPSTRRKKSVRISEVHIEKNTTSEIPPQ